MTMPETTEFQESIEHQEESTVQGNNQRQFIVPGDIDSEITGTFRSNEQGNIETIGTLEDDNQSSTSFSTVKSNSSIRLTRLD